MAQAASRQDEHGVIGLLEEAIHLLRRAPAGSLAAYYVGSLPFLLAVLYFWADMSRSAFAAQRLVAGSMGLGILFVWMKCWHAVFMRKLLAELCGQAPPRWPPRKIVRLVVTQAVIQPWGLFVLTLSVVAIVPFPWAYALWQNACLLGDGHEQSTLRRTLGGAWEQATVGVRQNVVVLLVLLLFGLFVLVNIAQAILLPSALLKMFLGVETIFTRGGFRMLNTTFLAITFGLTYLCIDPVVKAFYTLRHFYSRSRRTGQDLQADLQHLVSARKIATAGLLGVLAVLAACPARVAACELRGGVVLAASDPADPPAAPPKQSVSPKELDESVRRVISRREYAWRMPRERKQEGEQKAEQKARPKSFLDSVGEKIREWVRKFLEWLMKDRKRPVRSEPSGAGWVSVMQPILYVLLGVAAVVLAVLLWQAYRKRGAKPPKKAKEAAAATPDLEDEEVAADDLPEGDWLDLARQMLQKGDRRLALRAMYLASLALLAERGMIAIARFKSNGDYRGELQRRAHSMPDLVAAFAQNVGYFEDAWYGMHDVTGAIVRGFVANQKRIKGVGEA